MRALKKYTTAPPVLLPLRENDTFLVSPVASDLSDPSIYYFAEIVFKMKSVLNGVVPLRGPTAQQLLRLPSASLSSLWTVCGGTDLSLQGRTCHGYGSEARKDNIELPC